jgi:RNA polymerase sigma factor (TIGR02999 family)
LNEWSNGDPFALERLAPLVYSDLRRMAKFWLGKERLPNQTLQPTALIDEVLLRFLKQHSLRHWEDRESFFRAAASLMRNILVDYARKRRADKRGGASDRVDVTLAEEVPAPARNLVEILAVDQVLERLTALDPELAQVVELKYFAGLDVDEMADYLGVATATVKRRWSTARAWLLNELKA